MILKYPTSNRGSRKMKKLFILALGLLSSACFAFSPVASFSCAQAVPTTDGGFCPSFKSVANCHCQEQGMPAKVCQNMDLLYNAMVARYSTLERACANQHDTSTQNCIDDWNCYRNGGTNSQGGLCSSSGSKCWFSFNLSGLLCHTRALFLMSYYV